MNDQEQIASLEKEIPQLRQILNSRIKKLNELKSKNDFNNGGQYVDAHGDIVEVQQATIGTANYNYERHYDSL